MKFALPSLWMTMLTISLVGCGGGGGGGGANSGDVVEVKTYELKSLLPADFDTPDLDGGRIRVPTPKGWKVGSRQGDILLRFYTDDPTGVPRIVLKGEPSTFADITTVTQDNLPDFSDLVQAGLNEETNKSGKAHFREACTPMIFGENAWVRYVAAGRWKGHAIDRVLLKTIHNKRLYTIELNVMSGKIRDSQKAAYTVAGKMMFDPKPEGAPAAETPTVESAPPAKTE